MNWPVWITLAVTVGSVVWSVVATAQQSQREFERELSWGMKAVDAYKAFGGDGSPEGDA